MKNKIYKLLSIMLAIMMAFSCFSAALSVSASTTSTATYYVSAGGDNANSGTEETPFKTIGGALAKALEEAEAGGYNTADATVYLKVLGTDAVTFTDVTGVKYNFLLDISSATSGALLDNGANYSKSVFNGPVKFSNLTFKQYYGEGLYFCGNDFTFADDVTTILPSGWDQQGILCFGPDGTSETVTIDEAQDIYLHNSGSSVYCFFTVGGGKSYTYNNDLNFTYNAPNATQEFRFDAVSGSAKTTFNRNINLNLLAGVVSFWARNPARFAFGPHAALQIINSTGSDISRNADFDLAFANTPVYELVNKSGLKDLIKFTDTAGTYLVDTENYDVRAVPVNGGDAIPAADGKLIVPAGKYNIKVTASAQTATYYVSADGSDENDGKEETPFQTIAGAITKAVANAIEGNYNYDDSTVYLKLVGDSKYDISNLSSINYNFNLDISSATSGAVLSIPATATARFCGPTILNNLKISAGSWYTLATNGANFIMGDDVTIEASDRYSYFSVNNSNSSITEDQTVKFTNINGTRSTEYFSINGNRTTTYDANFNLIYNAPLYSQTIYVSPINANLAAYFNKQLNINVLGTAGITFALRTGGSVVFGKDASFQIINSSGNTIDYSAIKDSLPDKRYIITNLTGVKDIVEFTETAGTFTVKEGYDVKAVGPEKIVCEPSAGKIVLPVAGDYKLIIEKEHDPATNNYSEYIVARDGLKNTYLKLQNNEDINVVYFGGSVTGGAGASAADSTSWRGKVGNWLVENFPISNITNVNLGIGGTGTLLGLNRIESVISVDPDLVFVEFAINDFYNQASNDEAKTRLETIVRTIRNAKPDCDIVVLLISEKSKYQSDLKDELYGQAQAHDEIAAEYGLPSLYIGRALSDYMSTLDGEFEEIWSAHYVDIVHPSDAGYAVFFNVLKEFLNNELSHGAYEGEVADYTLPEQVSEMLLDGDTKILKVDQAFIDASNAKGGSGFTFNSKIVQYGSDNGYNPFVGAGENFAFKNDGSSYSGVGKLVFEFTGTELSVLSMGQNNTGYLVKIDDGEPYAVKLSSADPIILATGLKSGTHTAEVTMTYKDVVSTSSSYVDWIYAFFTRDATKSSHVHKYNNDYVSNNDATCDTDGTKSRECSLCGYVDTVVDEGTKGHIFTNYVSDGNATCDTDGTKTATCDRDGCDVKSDPIPDVGSKGHIWTNYVSDGNATCTEDGTKTATCDRDGCDVKSEAIPDVGSKLGHEFKNYVAKDAAKCGKNATEIATCTRCPETDVRDVAGTALTHKWSNATCTKAKTCSLCKATSGSALGHSYVSKVVKATTAANGSTYKQCSKCNSIISKVTINKIYTIKLSTTTYTYNGSNKTPTVTVKDTSGKTLKKDVDYTVTYPKYRRVAGKHKVIVKFKGKYSGTKNLYFTIKPLKLSKFTAKLSTTKYTYNGKAKTPAVTVKTTGGKTLKKNVDYTVTYPKYRKNVGKYKVVIKLKGNYSGSKALYFTVSPAKTSVKKLTAAKKSLKVAITKKSTQVTGYQVQYSTSKSFKSAKTKTVKSYKTTSVTLKSLKAKKTYYVRVRTFKKVGNTTYYSGWSTAKYKKTK